MLHVRQCLFATGFCLTIMTVWEFLQNFDLVPPGNGGFGAAFFWFVGLGFGALYNRAHHRHVGLRVNNRLKVLRADAQLEPERPRRASSRSRARASTRSRPARYDPSLPLAFRIAELFGLAIEEVFTSPSRHSSKAI